MMTHKYFMTALLLLSVFWLAPGVSAQDETPGAEKSNAETPKEKTDSGSQEVEYNDDNYRRYMELKDQPARTSNLPTNVYQSGTQKLDKLPEASQKHLRNQLREIILDGDGWAPGDEDKQYPYLPSAAAQQNPALKQQETEAWGELVGKYQEREAQIYNNASRSSSAAKAAGGAPDASQAQANAGESAEASASGSASESAGDSAADDGKKSGKSDAGDEKKQAGQEQQSAASSDQDSYSPASPTDPDANRPTGVSQNAMEFLLQKGSTDKQDGAVNNGSATLTAQGNAGKQNPAANAGTTQESSSDPDAESTAGISQNAMEFLTRSGQQQTDSATPGPNAAASADGLLTTSKGTLSIKDLQNAQGTRIPPGTGASQAAPLEPENSGDQGLPKDGG